MDIKERYGFLAMHNMQKNTEIYNDYVLAKKDEFCGGFFERNMIK